MKRHWTDEKDKRHIILGLIKEITWWILLPHTVPAVDSIPTISLHQLLIVGLTRVDGFVRAKNPAAGVGRNKIAPPVPPVRPCTEALSIRTRPDAT